MNRAGLGFMNLHQISVKPTALLKCGWIAEIVDKSRTILTDLVLLKKSSHNLIYAKEDFEEWTVSPSFL